MHCRIFTCDVGETQDFAAACPLRIVDYTPLWMGFDELPHRIHAELRRALPFLADVGDEVLLLSIITSCLASKFES